MSATTWQTPTSTSTPTTFAGLVHAEIRRYAWRRLTRVGFLVLMGAALLVWLLVVASAWSVGLGPTAVQPAEMVTGPLLAMTGLLSLLTMVVAASFVGADGSSGALSQWLTFAPNRTAVFWSKAVAAAVGSAMLGALGLGLTFVGATLTWVALVPGGVADPIETLPALLRGVAFICLAGLGGFAVSAAFGSTAATPIAAAGYFGVVTTRAILGISDAAWRFSPESSAIAFLSGGARFGYHVDDYKVSYIYVSGLAGGTTLAGWVALVLLLSYAWFLRREHA